ncbi:MAG: hypothetical protein NTW17_01435 [Candidatus Pacearchaeota archaeon]|nr:hypothetical protein [Candidatus Pacearchaeota archaeon]
MKTQAGIALAIIAIVFFMSVVSAEVIIIEPSSFDNINIYSGESITKNITIKTDSNDLVYLSYNITNNTYNPNGISVLFGASPVPVNGEKIIPVQILTSSSFKPDTFTVYLYASATKVEGIFSAAHNESSQNYDTGMGLKLEINSTGTGTVTIQKYLLSQPQGFGIPSLGKFFDIDATQDVLDNMGASRIEVSYTDAEVSAAGLDETTLRLYFFNGTTNTWEAIDAPNGGVNTTENYVWAYTNHFSSWGVFSLMPIATTTSGGSSSGGGGGGGSSIKTTIIQNTTNQTNKIATLNNENTGSTENKEQENKGFFATITGDVIGAAGTPGGIAVIFIVLVIGGAITVFIVRKNKR